jgi:8-oxo-dGTP pyrophosphatase MutT (NUDIX family)
MIGGHVNSSDTFKKAIIREASEEIGIVLQGKKIKYLCTLKPHGNSHNFKHIYYMFDNVNLNNLNLQIEEVSDIKKIKYEPYYKAIKNGDRNYSGN